MLLSRSLPWQSYAKQMIREAVAAAGGDGDRKKRQMHLHVRLSSMKAQKHRTHYSLYAVSHCLSIKRSHFESMNFGIINVLLEHLASSIGTVLGEC